MAARLQSGRFAPGAEIDAFIARGGHDIGAVASFVGTVRSTPSDPVVAMTLEHYPALAMRRLEAIEAEARARFELRDSEIVHRFGRLLAGEPIVLVLAAAARRQGALDAVAFMMDSLKTGAPFWKKEEPPDGPSRWVDEKASDVIARQRWAPAPRR